MILKKKLSRNDSTYQVYDEYGNSLFNLTSEEMNFLQTREKQYKKDEKRFEKRREKEIKNNGYFLSSTLSKHLNTAVKLNEEETEPLSDNEILSSGDYREENYYKRFSKQPK